MAKLIFMGWVNSQANEWEDYSNYFGVKTKISKNWATAFFLAFDSWFLELGFPGGSDGKESACNVGNLGSNPRLGRSP